MNKNETERVNWTIRKKAITVLKQASKLSGHSISKLASQAIIHSYGDREDQIIKQMNELEIQLKILAEKRVRIRELKKEAKK